MDEQFWSTVFNNAVTVTIVVTVVSLGLSLTVSDLGAALRRGRLLTALGAVNLLVLPALAWGVANLLPIASRDVTGLVLVAVGAGGAAGLKAVQLSRRGDLALAVSLVVLLQVADILVVPFWVRQVAAEASVSAGGIIASLAALVLGPLAIGLLLRARTPAAAAAWVPRLTSLSTITLVIALAAGVVANAAPLRALLLTWVPVAAATTTCAALALGWAVGGRDRAVRASSALVTGSRFGTLGLVIIVGQLDSDPRLLGPAVVGALVNLVLLLGTGAVVGRSKGPRRRDRDSARSRPTSH